MKNYLLTILSLAFGIVASIIILSSFCIMSDKPKLQEQNYTLHTISLQDLIDTEWRINIRDKYNDSIFLSYSFDNRATIYFV